MRSIPELYSLVSNLKVKWRLQLKRKKGLLAVTCHCYMAFWYSLRELEIYFWTENSLFKQQGKRYWQGVWNTCIGKLISFIYEPLQLSVKYAFIIILKITSSISSFTSILPFSIKVECTFWVMLRNTIEQILINSLLGSYSFAQNL